MFFDWGEIMDVSLIVLAAGNSSRMDGCNKQIMILDDEKPVLVHTLQVFEEVSSIHEIIVVTREQDIILIGDMLKNFRVNKKVKAIVPGGATRQDSVVAGLQHVTGEKVLIHDGARPFVTESIIDSVIQSLAEFDAVIPGVPVKDTIKRKTDTNEVCETVPREDLIAVQTPQGFTTKMMIAAHQKAKEDGIFVTDDASVAEYAGIPVKIISGDYKNIKITTPDDILIANAICMGR